MPTPEVPEDYSLSVVIESLQQTMLHFAIALLLAGIIINLSVSLSMAKNAPDTLKDILAQKAQQTPVMA